MNDPKKSPELSREVGAKVAQKLRARRDASQGVWFGLGMMGMIGWSVVVPTLAGAGIGVWLDNRHPGSHSWTLMLLFIGLVTGCLIAWHWVSKEGKEIREEQEDKGE